MKSFIKSLIVASVLGLTFVSVPSTAEAQRSPYWNNHWGWYNNTYRPYYNNYYYSNPYYGGYYGGGYYSRPYYGGYYGGYYGPGYYGRPGVGVNVGRLNFGWW